MTRNTNKIGIINSINVNPNGGVPKYSVDTTKLTINGVEGDKQRYKNHGGIDLVVSRKDLRDTIATLLSILLKKNKSEVTTENANIDEVAEPLQKTSEAV